jgi:mRNA interferase RelE/StbE
VKYQVFFEERARKEFARIDKTYQKIIARKIDQLAEDFNRFSKNLKMLQGEHKYYRLRIGKYRVILHKDDTRIIITIVRIGHRKNIYTNPPRKTQSKT